uniref:1-deoxy-D-xylulose-5-phosphate synthase n=1 Tax=Lygus hesperus TaxID=30085 RepID=A0A0A9Y494_LYGHE
MEMDNDLYIRCDISKLLRFLQRRIYVTAVYVVTNHKWFSEHGLMKPLEHEPPEAAKTLDWWYNGSLPCMQEEGCSGLVTQILTPVVAIFQEYLVPSITALLHELYNLPSNTPATVTTASWETNAS